MFAGNSAYMEKIKKLYPLKFQPIVIENSWGTENVCIADLGIEDSTVTHGWLEGNSMGDIMETYLERVVGESVYGYYGRQFPLLIKFVETKGDTPVFVHPDDTVAEQRYDALGGKELWCVVEAGKDAKIHLGFDHEISAQEVFERCSDGSIRSSMNVLEPKKGDCLVIEPGTVHGASGHLKIAVVKESSDLPFKLFDQEENGEELALSHLAEAMDFIDYKKYSAALPGNDRASGHIALPGNNDGSSAAKNTGAGNSDGEIAEKLVECPEFTVTRIKLKDPLRLTTEQFDSFIIYICIDGEASIQTGASDGSGKQDMVSLKKGEAVLVPAEIHDFFIVPADRDTVLLEAMAGKRDDADDYIDPDTEPFLEGEDYEGLEDEDHDSSSETASAPKSGPTRPKGHEKIYN